MVAKICHNLISTAFQKHNKFILTKCGSQKWFHRCWHNMHALFDTNMEYVDRTQSGIVVSIKFLRPQTIIIIFVYE